MKIKNKKKHRRTYGFRCLRKTGVPSSFTLEPNETSGELPPVVGLDVALKLMAQRDEITVTLNDNDKRFLGKAGIDALRVVKPKKAKKAIPAEVKKEVEEPPAEPPKTAGVPPVEPVVEEKPEEPPVCEDMPVAEDTNAATDDDTEPTEDETVEETGDDSAEENGADDAAGEEEETTFSLPKPPSKMNKGDWLAIGMLDEVGLKNEINPGMSKADLRKAVEDRLKELGLID